MQAGQVPGEGRGGRGGRRGGRTGRRSGNRREANKNNFPVYHETGRRKDDMVVDGNGKDADMDDLTRKRLAGMPLEGNAHNNTKGDATDKLAIVPIPVGTSMVSPPPIRDQKRSRKEGDDNENPSNVVKSLAGSFEEHRRAQ